MEYPQANSGRRIQNLKMTGAHARPVDCRLTGFMAPTAIRLCVFVTFLCLISLGAVPVSAAMVPDTLIRNVHIIRSGESEATDLVNLTILKRNLDMISKDNLKPQDDSEKLTRSTTRITRKLVARKLVA